MIELIYLFIIAFVLNFIWENLHRFLYVSYKNKSIDEPILLRAALVDAFIISLLYFFSQQFKSLIIPVFSIIIAGLIIAILMEKWALRKQRWVYSSKMPIIPLIKTGLTPTVQLALTGFVVFELMSMIFR